MITDYQRQLTEELQQAWTNLREEIVLVENTKTKDKLLFHVDKCIDWTPLLYLVPMQDSLEMIIHLIQLAGGQAALFEKIRKVKRLLEELNFTFTIQGGKP